VLIHAAAGGVGHLAVQIAKARGAHVTATASAAKHDFLREIGADA
jgi:NADPH:quinone reductase-like Zn-dependent oxidoreductase